MSYYVCKGKVDRYKGKNPTYKGNHFSDFFDYWVGYVKNPSELNLLFPFPQEYTDSDERIWLLREGKKPDNHQFNRKKELPFNNQLKYIPRNKEKYQDPKPKWSTCELNSLWKILKQKGKI